MSEEADAKQRMIAVARVNEDVVGYVAVSRSWNQCAQIDDIMISRNHRRCGLGRLLMNEAVLWTQEEHLAMIRLETQTNNVPACRFYEKYGFDLGGYIVICTVRCLRHGSTKPLSFGILIYQKASFLLQHRPNFATKPPNTAPKERRPAWQSCDDAFPWRSSEPAFTRQPGDRFCLKPGPSSPRPGGLPSKRRLPLHLLAAIPYMRGTLGIVSGGIQRLPSSARMPSKPRQPFEWGYSTNRSRVSPARTSADTTAPIPQ